MKLNTIAQIGAAAALGLITATASNAQNRIPITFPTGSGSFPAPFNSNGGGVGFILTPQMTGFQGFGQQFGSFFPNLGNATGFTNYTGFNNGMSTLNTNVLRGVASDQQFGFYGGYGGYGGYGYGDPSLVVTPNGVYPLNNGYNNGPTPAQMAQMAYEQGYIDAAKQAMANSQVGPATTAPSTSLGMTATPRYTAARVPHGSDGVRAWSVGNGQVALRWQGDPRIASSVTFAITDRNGRTLRGTTVNELPAEARLTPPAGAAFYEAVVHYVDGATNTIMGRLPR